jgi:raffinose/stachyose/melibiose transport system permease protein
MSTTTANPFPGRRLSIGTLARYAFLIGFSVVTIYPIWWLISVSLKTRQEYLAKPFSVPTRPVFQNALAILNTELIRRFFLNSALVTVISVVTVVIVGSLAGYALARYRWKGRETVLLLFLMSNMIPVTVLVIPLFVWLRWIHLLKGFAPLIMAYISLTLGLTVFLSRGFFRSISQDLLDAARLDGCNELQAFLYIMLPLARPGLVVIAILNFITVWNEYFMALVLVQDNAHYTIPLGLTVFRGKYDTDWPKLAAALLLATIPTMILYFVFQEQIVKGVGQGFSPGED